MWLLGQSTCKGTPARDTGYRDRVEELPAKPSTARPQPWGDGHPQPGGCEGGGGTVTSCRKRGHNSAAVCPQGMLQGHLPAKPSSDISEQRPAMTQQTAEPSGFLSPQGFPSWLPNHPRLGPCCAQQSPQRVLNVVRVLPAGRTICHHPPGPARSCHARIISEAAHSLRGAVPSSCPTQAGWGLGLPRALILNPVASPYLPVLPVNGGPLLAVGPVGRGDTERTHREGQGWAVPPCHHPPATLLSPSGHPSG